MQDATPITLKGQEFSGTRRQARPRRRTAAPGAGRTASTCAIGRNGGQERTQYAPQVHASAAAAREKIAEAHQCQSAATRANKFAALASRREGVFVKRCGRGRSPPTLDEDHRRHPLAGIRDRAPTSTNSPGRERARLLDHAGKGEPDAVRGHDDGHRCRPSATTSQSGFAELAEQLGSSASSTR